MMEKLTAKLGPLPVWVWGLFIGGLLVAWQWAARRGSGDAETGTAVDESTSAAVPSTPQFPSSGNSQGTNTIVTGENYEATPTERTNGQWLVLAVKAAVEKGVSTLTAQTALEKYITGQHLTAGEKAIVETALADENVGLPPEGVGGTPTWDTPKLPTRYVRVPPKSTVYRVESNGTLTPYTVQSWATFRLTPAGRAANIENLSGAEAQWANAAKKNAYI